MPNHHLLLSFFLLLSAFIAAADDGAAIIKIGSSFSPVPTGWSTTSPKNYCSWPGIQCDNSNRITDISLPSKSLSGILAAEISSLSELTLLALQQNALSGRIPSFAKLSNLQTINLDSNAFNSVAADAFSGLTSLQTLSMRDNSKLTPWSFPDLSQSRALVDLQLTNTNLHGPLPEMFAFWPTLTSIKLSYNNLNGTLPLSIGLSSIQNFSINNQANGLSGTIEVLSKMEQLSQVWLQSNMFTGPIPDFSKSLGIFDLQLRENQLTGPVPASLINLPNFKNVSLSNNKLQGPSPKFPSSVLNDATDGTNNFCTRNGDPCSPQVTTMLEIAGGFGYPVILSDSWAGDDACKFSFVNCTQGVLVTSVLLSNKGLIGFISPAFGNLTALKTLILSNNSLSGRIPSSLVTLVDLQLLDVSNNNLSGDLPIFPSAVNFSYSGNSLLRQGLDRKSESGGSGKSSTAMIIGIIVGVLVLASVVGLASYVYVMKKKKKHHELIVKSESKGNGNMLFEDLRRATEDFSAANILGSGGFGAVYKGVLEDGTQIAVKKMEGASSGTRGLTEFQTEIDMIRKVTHRHLVSLLGYCIHGDERLLVYEFMPQGTLADHLFNWQEKRYIPLTWKQRVTIALDVALGMAYLHSQAQERFIHRDLKPSNVLLGDDMRAKVADFGLVKVLLDDKSYVDTRVAGTVGYIAPEYATSGRVSIKVDVYAFGVILMEIITGKKALDKGLPEGNTLVTWFRAMLDNPEKISRAVDDKINCDEEAMASIYEVAELAGQCTVRKPNERPDMTHAVNVLGLLVEQWKPSNQEVEESSGSDVHSSLPETLRRWQADEGTSTRDDEIQVISNS